MASHDWNALQRQFLVDFELSQTSPKQWCEVRGINYATARRYIKKPAGTVAQKYEKASEEKPKKTVVAERKEVQGVISHGGYSKYFNQNIHMMATDGALEDELILCRARIHLVVATIEDIQERLKEKPPAEVAASLYESLFKADNALDRNIARVESISKTLSSIRLDNLNQHKIVEETKRLTQVTKATVVNAKKSRAQTELTTVQTDIARKQVGGSSKLDDYIDKVTASDSLDSVVS